MTMSNSIKVKDLMRLTLRLVQRSFSEVGSFSEGGVKDLLDCLKRRYIYAYSNKKTTLIKDG